MSNIESCVNCGDEYQVGEGYPKLDKGKWECCCSLDCWCEYIGVEEKPAYIKFEGDAE